MGHHNLPRDYDAWRLSTPWDDHKRHVATPATIRQCLLIEAGEITIDADGEYDTESCELVTVWINGVDFAPHQVSAMLAVFAPRQTGHWDADMDSDEMGNLISELIEDSECYRADYQRDRDLDH